MVQDHLNNLPDPPDAPEIQPHVVLRSSQWVLLLLMLILPVLALLGVFGERHASASIQSGPLDVTVHYPSVLRYKIVDHLELSVHNRGAITLDSIGVAMDTTYARQFSDVAATPPFEHSYQLWLDPLEAGGSRLIRIQLKAERYWRHRGALTVSAGADTARVLFSTIVYP